MPKWVFIFLCLFALLFGGCSGSDDDFFGDLDSAPGDLDEDIDTDGDAEMDSFEEFENDPDTSVNDGDTEQPDGDSVEAEDMEEESKDVDSEEDVFDGDGTENDAIDSTETDGDSDLMEEDESEVEVDSEEDVSDGDGMEDDAIDNTETDGDESEVEVDSEEELGCVRGERFCDCLGDDTCLSEVDICRDGICEYCEPGEQYCPCHGIVCDPPYICYEEICLHEDEIDGDEEVVCPGGYECECYNDFTCQEGLECRLGTICLEECLPFHAGEWGCMCAGNFCYEVGTECVDDVCIPEDWIDGDAG